MRRVDKKEVKNFFEKNKEILERVGHTEACIFSAKCSLLRDHLALGDMMMLEVSLNHMVATFWSMMNAIYVHDKKRYKEEKINFEDSIQNLMTFLHEEMERVEKALREKMI